MWAFHKQMNPVVSLTLSSLVAPDIVITATRGDTSDAKVVTVTVHDPSTDSKSMNLKII